MKNFLNNVEKKLGWTGIFLLILTASIYFYVSPSVWGLKLFIILINYVCFDIGTAILFSQFKHYISESVGRLTNRNWRNPQGDIDDEILDKVDDMLEYLLNKHKETLIYTILLFDLISVIAFKSYIVTSALFFMFSILGSRSE